MKSATFIVTKVSHQ